MIGVEGLAICSRSFKAIDAEDKVPYHNNTLNRNLQPPGAVYQGSPTPPPHQKGPL